MTPHRVEDMPTYEYRCKNCDHQFEIVQAFSDDALTVCPECGGPLKKVFGNVGISFKGGGFYKTDSRSAGSFGSTKDADTPSTRSSSSDASSTSSSTSSDSSSSSGGSSSTSSSSTSSSSGSSSSTSGGSGSSGSSTTT